MRPLAPLFLLAAATLACSSPPAVDAPFEGGPDGGADVTVADAPTLAPFGDGAVDRAEPVCAGRIERARRAPLDLTVMVDSSGSMGERTSSGRPKWDEVRAALRSFVRDPRSAEIGAALQFFPLRPAGVPAQCSTAAQCRGYGPCSNRACVGPSASEFTPCETSLQCPSGATCMDLGTCSLSDALCLYTGPGATCPSGQGTCGKMALADCANADLCTVQDYARPALPTAALSGGADAFVAALDARVLSGQTPTSAALGGALTFAASAARAQPDHTVAVMLVTDGLPTSCAPTDTAGIAALAAARAPKIRTFVVGVFAPFEEAKARDTLDAIAKAGGSEKAHLVTTSQDVTKGLVAAFDAIRTTALPCAFAVPKPDAGTPDYGKLNVLHTAGDGTTAVLPYVASEGACDAARGGWYYDVDPASGARPASVVVCPKSCAAIKGDTRASVEIQLGCATQLK